MHTPPATLLTRLRAHAEGQGARTAFIFLDALGQETRRLSFGALATASHAVAQRVGARVERQARVALLLPAAEQFVPVFMGCLAAGVVAVPVSPPPARKPATTALTVLASAQPTLVVASPALREQLEGGLHERGLSPEWVTPEELLAPAEDANAAHVVPPEPTPDELAFLQYSSGSTSDPKGVMVSHGNVAHNALAIAEAFAVDADTVAGGWLPLHHDMGLIGLVLTPIYLGISSVLMPPIAFLARPARWLQMVSTYRIAYSGGPNFAFDHCVDRISDAEKAGLDLASWRVAFNGAEPVQARTLRRFADAFAGCGFRPEALYPCYGLAESTLFVSGGHWAGEGGANEASRPACGRTPAGAVLRIVEPEHRQPCADGEVGEVWVAGPSVAQGYFGQPELSDAAFRARVAGAGDARTYLRTGDLGFLRDGALCITGRLKDLIVIRGRNFHPQDIEFACESGEGGERRGFCVAFSDCGEQGEQLFVVAEAARSVPATDLGRLALQMRERVVSRMGVSIDRLAFVPSGALPRTTSGKARRFLCKTLLLSDQLNVLYADQPGARA